MLAPRAPAGAHAVTSFRAESLDSAQESGPDQRRLAE